jgi:multicomponent Na+:H+ antiporter subunit F
MIPNIVLLLSTLALFLALYRVIFGPTHADRVVALDIFFSCSVALCVLASWMVERTVFLDVAIGLSLVGFVATVCWARLLDRASTGESDSGQGGEKG